MAFTTTKDGQRLLARAVSKALTQVGVQESPLYSNKGPEVNQYLMAVGLNPGNFWCMAFVYWLFKIAALDLGLTNPLIRTAGVVDHWNRAAKGKYRRITKAQALADPTLIRPGQIMCLLIAPLTGAGHTGIVVDYDGEILTTIEGNSAENGSRNGSGVYLLTSRKLTSKTLLGFIDYSQQKDI